VAKSTVRSNLGLVGRKWSGRGGAVLEIQPEEKNFKTKLNILSHTKIKLSVKKI